MQNSIKQLESEQAADARDNPFIASLTREQKDRLALYRSQFKPKRTLFQKFIRGLFGLSPLILLFLLGAWHAFGNTVVLDLFGNVLAKWDWPKDRLVIIVAPTNGNPGGTPGPFVYIVPATPTCSSPRPAYTPPPYATPFPLGH